MTVGCAVIGYGFMGRTHAAAYENAARDGYNCALQPYTETDEILDASDVHVVSICTPTDSHVELAARAMKAGKHVLLEKPVALNVPDIQMLQAVSARTRRVCMPAHCMRFWPAWPLLRDTILSGEYGRVISARFRRVSRIPPWNMEFYSNLARSGGALFDLHIHDADFILWTFGEPLSLTSSGSVMHVNTTYRYDNVGATAEGIWSVEDVPFEMKYHVELEHAVFDFDVSRTPTLHVTTHGPTSHTTKTADVSAYDVQVAHFLDVVAGRVEPRVTLDDAIRVTRLLERERSMLAGGPPGPPFQH